MISLWVSYVWIVSNLLTACAARFHPHPRTSSPQLSPTRRASQTCDRKAQFGLSLDSDLLYYYY